MLKLKFVFGTHFFLSKTIKFGTVRQGSFLYSYIYQCLEKGRWNGGVIGGREF